MQHHQAARAVFLGLGRDVDVARTLNGALQSLICLGRYDEALASAGEARAIFERHGNLLGLARLDSNIGNILYRQDRFAEALVLYERAHEQLTRVGEPQDVAAALSNMAVVQISLNGFDNAVKAYHEARALCERHDMPLFTLRADYNIAGLYYLRGEYTRALDLYRAARDQSDRLGDVYHRALCDLDRSEIYLELNLSDEAAELAAQARGRVRAARDDLRSGEGGHDPRAHDEPPGDRRRSHELFAHARRLFAREGNQVWLGLLDFYEALVLFREAQLRARGPAVPAGATAVRAGLAAGQGGALRSAAVAPGAAGGRSAAAEQACDAAFEKLAVAETPMLAYQAHCVLGLLREAQGEPERAFEAFQRADDSLEQLRNHLQSESLRVAFLEDKLDVYERLVTTCLTAGPDAAHEEAAFRYIEQAKSRSLADLIAFRAVNLAPRVAGAASDEVRRLRQELNWHSRQVEQEELKPDGTLAPPHGPLGGTRAGDRETARPGARRDPAHRRRVLGAAKRHDVQRRRDPRQPGPGRDHPRVLPGHGPLYVCVLSHDRLDIVPLGAAADVRSRLQLLQFQLAKFRRGPDQAGPSPSRCGPRPRRTCARCMRR